VLGLLFPAPAVAAAGEPVLLDDFRDLSVWQAAPSDGVSLEILQVPAPEGPALRLAFDFHGGGGYAVIRRALDLELPGNYRFTLRMRGEGLPNNLEFKLVDASGENVWWVNRRNFAFPLDWSEVALLKRHVEFAWGPAGGGEIRRVARLEIAVTAGSGGRGTVDLAELRLEPLPPSRPYDRTPGIQASSYAPGFGPERLVDGEPSTGWRSRGGGTQRIDLDFGEVREFGGLVLDWEGGLHASAYRVMLSEDGRRWREAASATRANGGRDWIYLPESESRYLRIVIERGPGPAYGLRALDVRPLGFSANPNTFFETIARESPRGMFPRYFLGEQVYWTVAGVSGDTEEALLNEDGALEAGQATFSLEPLVVWNGELADWSDVSRTPSLAEGELPIPSVRWSHLEFDLDVEALAAGDPGASILIATYRLSNRAPEVRAARLVVTVRPFQVNPSYQFLNTPGGVADVRSLTWDGRVLVANGERSVIPLMPPDVVGLAAFEEGDVSEWLRGGTLPPGTAADCSLGRASGAMAFDLDIGPRQAVEVAIVLPFHGAGIEAAERFGLRPGDDPAMLTADVARLRVEVVRGWREALSRVQFEVPAEAETLIRTLRTNLAYILIHRDGPAIQPGSRAYARSWIRDGSMTSTALLRLGHDEAAQAFLEWYAPFQYPDGKVPCCVDWRGADPVPEHDSHGQLIWLLAQVHRYIGDRVLAERLWPRADAAAGYLDRLRRQRRSEAYRAPDLLPYFGLLPESISHEGYADKPVHSYWDGFFAVRGLKDAAWLARELNVGSRADALEAIRDEFRRDLHTSIRRVMTMHGIDYVPGSVEKGDFDPTSTTVALDPAGELESLPPDALRRTFERYWEQFVARREGRMEWENYTPYELRNVGAFVRLGWRGRAHELLDFFMADRRPAAWNHWAEVVWRDPLLPRFIGDMPHGWVGSDYIRAVLDLFAWERDEDEAIVLASGLPTQWLEAGGVSIRELRTPFGLLSFSVRADGESLQLLLEDGAEVPPGGFVLPWPYEGFPASAAVNGKEAGLNARGEVVIREIPAHVVLGR
jgi:hypothetical protein